MTPNCFYFFVSFSFLIPGIFTRVDNTERAMHSWSLYACLILFSSPNARRLCDWHQAYIQRVCGLGIFSTQSTHALSSCYLGANQPHCPTRAYHLVLLKAPFTHSRFLATVPLRFATICKIVVYRGVPWSFVVEPW